MRVEIDQSGKIEHLNTDTIVTYSNGTKGSVKITAGTKRTLVQHLKQSVLPSDVIKPIIFAICIYLLVKSLPKDTVLEIDEEYTGKELVISNALERLLQKHWKNKWAGDIRFRRIGKDSPAHYLAWRSHRFQKKYVTKKLKIEEILGLLK